jgi:hypothetical protein
MLKRIKHQKSREDDSKLAPELVSVSPRETDVTIALPSKSQISLLMAQLGRKGGKIGGKRRLETMTGRERTAIARKAAQARWAQKEE